MKIRILSIRTAAFVVLLCSTVSTLLAREWESSGGGGPAASLSMILGRPTDRSITISVLSATAIEARIEYGIKPGIFTEKTEPWTAKPGAPFEFEIGGLNPNTRYYYQLLTRPPGASNFKPLPQAEFHTQR